jgi:hypothetical protein
MGTRKKRKFRPISYFLVLTMMIMMSSNVFAAVTTDQADYAPGSVVTISGDNSDDAGYLPGETVIVDVAGPNGYTASFETLVDANGAWFGNVVLWDSPLAIGSYMYTAKGLSSGVFEKGTFTDGNKIKTLSINAQSGTLYNGGVGSASFNITIGWNNSNADSDSLNFEWVSTPTGITPSWTTFALSYPTNTATLTMSANTPNVIVAGSYEFKIKSGDGKVIASKTLTITSDTTAPTVAPTANPSGWTNQEVTITPNVSDSQSGVNTGSFKYAPGHLSASAANYEDVSAVYFSGTFTRSVYGEYTVFAKDNAGNIGVGYVTSLYDNSAPTLAPTANPSDWTNQTITITPNATDPGSNQSGVDTGSYRYASGHITTNIAANYNTATAFSGTFTKNEYSEFTVFAKDNAGNIGVGYVTAYYDAEGPTVAPTANPSGWTNQAVTITPNVSDSGSGVNTGSFKYASGHLTASDANYASATTFTGTFSVSAYGEYTVFAKDIAGNIGVGYVTAYYDDSAPTVAPTANPSGWTNQSITITPNATDPGSNQSLVDTGSYRYASGHLTASDVNYASAATFTGTFSVSAYGEYTVFVKDNAGNIGVGYVTSYYDDSAPTVAPTANPSGWTNQSITITPNATDPGSNQSVMVKLFCNT